MYVADLELEFWHGAYYVGFLGVGQPYPTGIVQADVTEKLKDLLSRPIFSHKGYHNCPFCGQANGSKEHLVPSKNGELYLVPSPIVHYIESHNYLPPKKFLEAVVHSPASGTESYKEAILSAVRKTYKSRGELDILIKELKGDGPLVRERKLFCVNRLV